MANSPTYVATVKMSRAIAEKLLSNALPYKQGMRCIRVVAETHIMPVNLTWPVIPGAEVHLG